MSQDLAAAIREIQERVRRRHPTSAKGQIELADLKPAVAARDAAAAKIAAIGRVNPRAGGPVNAVIQAAKRLVARSLNWFVRDQVEFNRASVQCIEALMEAHNDTNRALAELADRIEGIKVIDLPPLQGEAKELADVRSHWVEWRREWERRLTLNEAQFMRSLADLQLAYQQKLSLSEAEARDRIALQHRDYLGALDRATREIQAKLWADFDRKSIDIERQIHEELRLVRQRPLLGATVASAAVTPNAVTGPIDIDWLAFAGKFRGPEDDIRQRFERYAAVFAGRENVLDLGCGRGEFLSLVPGAKGIDLSVENIAICQGKGWAAEQADIFAYLEATPRQSLGGIFCAQVIEHLAAAQLPALIKLCAAKLQPGAPVVFETPNPECLAIFATHFYIDPTHTRPVPPVLLDFYLQEAGFREIEIERIGSAANDFPELAQLPEGVRQRFFGGLDYCIRARA